MNCKPGDMAFVMGSSKKHPSTEGIIVEILYASTVGYFTLPCGTPTFNSYSGAPCWVVKFQRPLPIRWSDGKLRDATHATCPDKRLRPIRNPGDDARDETLEWLPVPSRTTEPEAA